MKTGPDVRFPGAAKVEVTPACIRFDRGLLVVREVSCNDQMGAQLKSNIRFFNNIDFQLLNCVTQVGLFLYYSSQKLLALVLLALASPAGASPLFEDETVREITLSGPFSSLIKDKENREEIPFVLYENGLEHLIKIRVRGKSRTSVCDFPPLRLNFSPDKTAETVFANQNKLKLVTHCKNKDSAQANILKEYAAYKIFNLISDVSYKVRLVHVTYMDTDKRTEE
ncbi:MAG: hypothetical protein MUP31_06190, partial [Xanthomonadales bacterium]|nr:hypothetical protein [Xanthomonadales bacterium]